MAKEKKQKEEVKGTDQIEEYLKENEKDHYNFSPPIDYGISSGSLLFDLEAGLVRPGCIRVIGGRENGKTSYCLSVGKNYQETVSNSFVCFIKAEGRLSEQMLLRSGIDTSPEKFRIIKSNIFEFCIDLMKNLVRNNEEDKRYMFIIDSVDALQTRAEASQTTEETVQPGTAAKKLSQMFRNISLAFSELGHVGLFISQNRSSIDINPYVPKAQKQGDTGGGNSIQHYTSECYHFLPKFKSDLIYEDDNPKLKILGHNCKVEILKSSSEKTYTKLEYPIKYGQTGGNSIWKSREVCALLLMFSHARAEKKGYILNEETSLIKEIKEKFSIKYNQIFTFGKNYYQYFEDNQDISEYLWKRFKEVLFPAK